MFSVIVPTYHRNDLLRNCLVALSSSVQTIASNEYEVIVTDNGKTSTAEAMVRDEFPWARWVAGPQTNPGGNRNAGAKHARGTWLIFTDDDCVPTPNFIAGYKAAIAAQARPAQAYEGRTTCVEGIHSPMYGSPINLVGSCFWACNIMIASDLFWQMGGFDEGFTVPGNEDVDLRERLKYTNQPIGFVHDAVVDHPPRLMNLGAGAGRLRETLVRMWYKTGNHSAKTINIKIIKIVIAENLHRIKQYQISKDSFERCGAQQLNLFTFAPIYPDGIVSTRKPLMVKYHPTFILTETNYYGKHYTKKDIC